MLKKFLIGTAVFAFLAYAGVASADCTITTTLKVGSTGSEVSCLQTKVGATSDGSFGPMTKASVMAYQASHGLSADGVVGPLSRAVLNGSPVAATVAGCPAGALFNSLTGASCTAATSTVAGCAAGALFSATTGASCTATTGTTTVVSGGAGDLLVTTTSTDVETDVIEGAADVKVLGFKGEADGSDVSLTNVKVTLINANTDGGTASSTRLERYISDVSVWMGSTKVGTALAADFSKDGSTYTKNITLSNAVVKEGTANKATFYVSFSALPNIDSTDLANDSWSVMVDNIRFVDGAGAIMTDSYSQTINSTSKNATINFISLASSGDVKITVSKASTSPVAQNVEVSTTGSTSGVTMLEFKVKAAGTPVTFSSMDFTVSNSAATNNNTIASDLYLMKGTTTLGSIDTFATSGNTFTITLDDDLVIAAGETQTFKVVAKIKAIGAGTGNSSNFDQGDYLNVRLAATPFSGTHEDSNGDTVTDITGSALGDNQTFYSTGISASNFTSSLVTTTVDGSNTRQTYSFSVKVSAFGDTYYMPKTLVRTATTAGVATQGMVLSLETSAGAVNAGGTLSLSSITSTADTVSSYFEIPAGESRTFTGTVAVTSADDAAITGHGALTVPGFYHLQLEAVRYDTDQSGTPSSYTVAPAANFETADAQIHL